MEKLQIKFSLKKGDVLEIRSSHDLFIYMMDYKNFVSYVKNKPYVYKGGRYRIFPVRIKVEKSANWYLVLIFQSGLEKPPRYSINIL